MICTIYNISGISGQENINYYIECINNILKQDYKNNKLIISSCLNTKETIDHLSKIFYEKISINWIQELIPVNCSFNHSVQKTIEKYGNIFEGFLYLDSGINFENQTNIITKLYQSFKNGQNGMVAALTDTNSGMYDWFGIGNINDTNVDALKWFLSNLDDDFIIPLGKTVNLHCQIYSKKLIDFYKRPIIDCLAGESHESLSTFQNAALNLKFLINKDIIVHHAHSLDGPSSGFPPWKFVNETGQPTCFHGFKCNNILERIQNGKRFGLGYEELKYIQLHDKSKFDNNGYALCPELKDYIRDNLFLNPNELDYNNIKSTWI